jgi:glutathione S-transferase
MLELYQAEWCPSSHRVRQVLTELGVDFVARQVPVEKAARRRLQAAAGTSTIPLLVPPNGPPVAGEAAIVRYLEARYPRTAAAEAHRAKAAAMAATSLPAAS